MACCRSVVARLWVVVLALAPIMGGRPHNTADAGPWVRYSANRTLHRAGLPTTIGVSAIAAPPGDTYFQPAPVSPLSTATGVTAELPAEMPVELPAEMPPEMPVEMETPVAMPQKMEMMPPPAMPLETPAEASPGIEASPGSPDQPAGDAETIRYLPATPVLSEVGGDPCCPECGRRHPLAEGCLDWLPRRLLSKKRLPSLSPWDWGFLEEKPHRFAGPGEPLHGTSWLNRPHHADWFFGALFGGKLIRGRIQQGSQVFGGYRFGKDLNHYWGWETRVGLAALPLIDMFNQPNSRSSNVVLWDVSFLYYPWGDARWRPYVIGGLGVANFNFDDETGNGYNEMQVGMPIGIGVKHIWREWAVIRAELLDNFAFGGRSVDSMHNISLTFGVEVHFGGRRRSYWPWNPSRYAW